MAKNDGIMYIDTPNWGVGKREAEKDTESEFRAWKKRMNLTGKKVDTKKEFEAYKKRQKLKRL